MTHELLITAVVALAAGVSVQVIAHHLRFPAIAILLLAGIALGPEGLGVVLPESLGAGFEPLVGLAVAIILFEGGLTLDTDGLRSAPRVIRRLVTTGAVITWLGSAALAMLLLDVSLPIALLAGSLIIVTGPTVVTPLLRRIGVVKRLHHILHWEAVLIDPIGVFVALLCFEWVILAAETGATSPLAPLAGFAVRVVVGTAVGIAGGGALAYLLRLRWIPTDHANIAVLTGALLLYGLADLALPHTGILAVTIAGLVLGWFRPPQLHELRDFKLEMTELAVAFLFILLAADLEIAAFSELGMGGVYLLIGLIAIVRPLVVMTSTWRESMTWRERAFLSWIAPRGIVAASMASLFAHQLSHTSIEGASIIEPFTFAVIGATVLLQGSSAGLAARILGVRQAQRRGWLIVGGRRLGLEVGLSLKRAGVPVVLVDQNENRVTEAEAAGLTAITSDALDPALGDDPQLAEVGSVLVATDNPVLNTMVAQRWSEQFRDREVHTWSDICTGQSLGQDIRTASVHESFAMPARVSDALDDDELRVALVAAGEPSPARSHDLFKMVGATARVAGDAGSSDSDRIVLGWRTFTTGDLFKRVVALHEADLTAAYGKLATEVSELRPQLARSTVLAALERQTGSYSVVVGNGVAIPHVVTDAVAEPMCIVGVLPETREDDDVRVVFLLLSPAGAPEMHLRALATVAGWASSSARVQDLIETTTTEQALAMLNAYAPPEAAASATLGSS